MTTNKITPEELWARQQINPLDVDYDLWNERRASIQTFSQMSHSCIFTVDVFKERYDFASDNFATIFGYNPTWIKTIHKQGDLLEERIHPDDRAQLIEHQIEHGQFIYSLPQEQRNDYQQIFQIRMLNARQEYVNVISRHQVIQKDKNEMCIRDSFLRFQVQDEHNASSIFICLWTELSQSICKSIKKP